MYTLLDVLQSVVMDINDLQEYYLYQSKSVKEHIKKTLPKYKYGLTLDRYFYNQIIGTEFFQLSEKEKKTIENIVESYSKHAQDEKTVIQYKLKNIDNLKSYELNPYLSKIKFFHLINQPHILNESTLIMLLIKYENAITGVFRFLIENYSNAYLQGKSITYSELISIESNDNIKDYFICQEVENIMRSSLDDWYKLFRSKHSAKFSFFDNEFKDFKEIYYRRNLIVHNNGQVNEIYLKNTPNTNLANGTLLVTDSDYINQAFTKTLIVLYGTFWELKKVDNQSEALFEFMFKQGYEYMSRKHWKLSKFIFNLLKDTDSSNLNKMCAQFNYWISIKNDEGIKKIEEEIRNLDVSAMKSEFLVAKFALLDDFPKVSDILDQKIETEIPVQDILENPLFIQYRKSNEYKEFVKNHSGIFESNKYEYDEQNEEEKLSNLENNLSVKDFLELLDLE